MNFQPVAVVACGPLTFRCCRCFAKVQQDPEETPPCPVRVTDYRRGVVWADLDGTPFEFYCTPCKDLTVAESTN